MMKTAIIFAAILGLTLATVGHYGRYYDDDYHGGYMGYPYGGYGGYGGFGGVGFVGVGVGGYGGYGYGGFGGYRGGWGHGWRRPYWKGYRPYWGWRSWYPYHRKGYY